MKHLVVGAAGSCGTATSYLLSRLLKEKAVYTFDIDKARKIKYAGTKRVASLKEASPVNKELIFVHVCVPEDHVESAVVHATNSGFQDSVFIIHSTMAVGQTQQLKKRYGINVFLNPLFFRDLHIEYDMEVPYRIVFGVDVQSTYAPAVRSFAKKWGDRCKYVATVHFLSFEEAEVIKLATNALRAVAITFYNTIDELLPGKAANKKSVIELLNPSKVLTGFEGGAWGTKIEKLGLPYGGKCLPKDTKHLALALAKPNIFDSVEKINNKKRATI